MYSTAKTISRQEFQTDNSRLWGTGSGVLLNGKTSFIYLFNLF
ncbi:hypothetical protein [Fortiea sp. LEGE XX443]